MASSSVRAQSAVRRGAKDVQLFQRGGKLRVAVYAQFEPVAYRGPPVGGRPGELRGLDVDIVRAFCAATGLTPGFVPIRYFWDTWDKTGEWDNRVDMAIGGVSRAAHRDSPGVEWSMPYFRVQRTIVYRLDDPIRRFPEDVTGKIAGTMGTIGMNDAYDKMIKVHGEKTWDMMVQGKTDAQDMRDLLSGKLQGLMRGSFVGAALVAKHPKRLGMTAPWDADGSSTGPGGEVFAFPCRRGSGLAGLLNVFLSGAAADGTLRALKRKHRMV